MKDVMSLSAAAAIETIEKVRREVQLSDREFWAYRLGVTEAVITMRRDMGAPDSELIQRVFIAEHDRMIQNLNEETIEGEVASIESWLEKEAGE